MRKLGSRALTAIAAISMLAAAPAQAAEPEAYKDAAAEGVDARAKLVQEMVDSIFSFQEPGFQEFKTQEYITGILEKNGFTIKKGVAGIPSAWTATWSNGEGPKIALGSDVDGLLGLSQKPGVGEITPLVPGAPGHGEGHNTGMPLIVAAALSVKDVMEANGVKGTLMIWPGIAEELLATKAYFVRDGLFDGFDACIFTHVSTTLGTGWGQGSGNGLVSVEYTFHGKTSHAAGAPWAGRSALDGVELMDVAWNFRREHLPLSQRSHYIITNGGGQPNIVPGEASVWYYFRDHTFQGIRDLFEIGNTISEAAASATGTTVTRRTLGYAAPQWANRPMAEAAYENIKKVGMPDWTEDDQAFVKKIQEANDRKLTPLATEVGELSVPKDVPAMGGPSDDIGDIMWTLPTITIGYPSQAPNMIFHNVLAAMTEATPIAHKGAVAGAKAVAMTVLDLMTTPELLAAAKKYQQDVQFAAETYDPLLTPEDKPAIDLNGELMGRLRPELEKFYYDPSKYDSYLDQLGVSYPDE